MADEAVNSVLAGGEEDQNPIPGSQDDTSLDSGPGGAVGPTGGSGAPISTPPIAPAPSPIQVDSAQKVHPHMAILAGLLKGILGGIQNAPGNPRNAFDRGFMNASPNQQALNQAALSKAQSAADLEKMQVSITGLKAMQLEYMIKRLPQQEQEQYLEKVGNFKQVLIRDGANIEATADDEKAADSQSVHLNATDQRATSHAGRFYSLPEPVEPGKPPKYDVVFVPNKNVLQDDFKWTDSDGKEHVIEKGTPFAGGLGKLVDEMQKDAQGQTKEEHKKVADALGPVADDKAAGTADYLQRLKDSNNPLYQQNKAAIDAAIPQLKARFAEAKEEKIKQAQAMATRVTIPTAEAKEGIKHDFDPVYARDESGNLVATNRKTATAQGYSDIDDTITKADVTTDRKTAPIIKDVRGKLQEYQAEIKKGDLSGWENARLAEITGMMDADTDVRLHAGALVKGAGAGGSVGLGATMKGLQQLFKNIEISRLSDKAEKRLVAYIAARSSALELQKAQTQSSRASKEGLTLDLAQIPHPGIEGRTANDQLDTLLKSVDRISSENPFAEDKTAKFLRKLAGRPSSE